MAKIALCFSGQARSFVKGFHYYKDNLLDNNDVDVFIHTWEDVRLHELKEFYKPKAMLIEPKLTEDFDRKYPNNPNPEKHPPRFTVSAFYSMFQVNKLRIEHEVKNKFVYDWVIKTRTDYALNVKIPFDSLDKTKLYIPNCRMVPTRDFGNDQFAFGSSATMRKYMNTYLFLNHFYDQGIQMIGEDMMSANLKENNLYGENLVYVNMNNPFPPGPQNGTWHSLIRDDYEEWKNK